MIIFVVDDHPLMREAIVMLVRRLNPQALVVELERMAVIDAAIATHGLPDLISLDLKLPDTHGVSGVRELKSKYKNVPLVVLSSSPASEYEDLAMEAGADAYIEKSAGATEITNMLRSFMSLDSDLDASVDTEKLSKRQKQLLGLLDLGLSNRDIADKLGISEHTVKVHLWRLFRRLDVKSRTQATHWARSQGLI
jgi:DNA-binding NarL/FixJ family response regulator